MSVKIETITEDTGNTAHGTMTPQSPSKWAPGTSHSSASLCQLPRCISLNLINDLKSLPFQR